MPQNYLRAEFQKYFSPDAILARYLQVHDWDPFRDRFVATPKDLGGLIAIEYEDRTS